MSNYVDVCNDIEYIQKYVNISKEKNIEYRVLACIAEKELPQMELSIEENMFFWDMIMRILEAVIILLY